MNYEIHLSARVSSRLGPVYRAEVADGDLGVWAESKDRTEAINKAIAGYDAVRPRVGLAQQPQQPIASKKVAVTPHVIREVVQNAADLGAIIVLDYQDAGGTVTEARRVRCREFRASSPEMLVAIDLAKDEVRHFIVSRILRVESAE